jgi:hypothetical protein
MPCSLANRTQTVSFILNNSNYLILDWTRLDQLCDTPLDSFQYISFDFQKAGYYTHETEDYANGVLGKLFNYVEINKLQILDWADCVGFKKPHTDHFMRPFWWEVGYHKGARKFFIWIFENVLKLCVFSSLPRLKNS